MPVVPLDSVGMVGVVKDLPDYTLPPDVWSDALNVRFADNKVSKTLGTTQVFGTPTVTPYWAAPVLGPSQVFWFYSDKAKMYCYDGATHGNVTRSVGGDYSASNADLWHLTILGGIPIFNNGVDDPQYWSAFSNSTPIADLTNWPANLLCKKLIAFKGHLIALNVTESSTNYPHRMKWSDAADPGTLPGSWDETDPTTNAGEVDLSDTESGRILDAMILGDLLMIYKERSVWSAQFIGGQSIFRTTQVFNSFGIMDSNCVANIPLRRGHLLYTGEDLVRHNGVEAVSVADKRIHKHLLNGVDNSAFTRAFMFNYRANHEIWFCYPEVGETAPNIAAVWNWQDDTLSFRDLTNINWITSGPVSGTIDTSWNNDAATWEVDLEQWDNQQFRTFQFDPVFCDVSAVKLLQGDQTEQFDAVNYTARVERSGLAITGQDMRGNIVVDYQTRKLMRRMWPKMSGGPVNIYFGVQENRGAAINWSQPAAFDPMTDLFVAPVDIDGSMLSGRLMAVRIESTTNVGWTLEGYDLDFDVLGNF